MKINQLLNGFEIYTTNEERAMLDKLTRPIKMASLTEREKVIAENMIRKSLLIKVGFNDPSIVKNEH
jgi:hypothetical protein